jgi:hypothetical protein
LTPDLDSDHLYFVIFLLGGYRQAIFKRISPASNEDRAFSLAAAILGFLIIAATGTGDAIAKGHGTYMPMVFGCQ